MGDGTVVILIGSRMVKGGGAMGEVAFLLDTIGGPRETRPLLVRGVAIERQ